MSIDPARARRMALDILARREHSRQELRSKLVRRGCAPKLSDDIVAGLARDGLLSEERFAEALVRVRAERGYGPLRIRKELEDKGVDGELIGRCVDATDSQWIEILRRVRRKRFGNKLPSSFAERARQARFLQYRGFPYDQIQRALSSDDE